SPWGTCRGRGRASSGGPGERGTPCSATGRSRRCGTRGQSRSRVSTAGGRRASGSGPGGGDGRAPPRQEKGRARAAVGRDRRASGQSQTTQEARPNAWRGGGQVSGGYGALAGPA